jgi:hypothetical protein
MKDLLTTITEKVQSRTKELSDNPLKFKEVFKDIDKRLLEIKEDKNIANRVEKYRIDIEFSSLQLLRLKHIMIIYSDLFGLTEDEVIFYLINNGIFLKIYELSLIRQKIIEMSNNLIEPENDASIGI